MGYRFYASRDVLELSVPNITGGCEILVPSLTGLGIHLAPGYPGLPSWALV